MKHTQVSALLDAGVPLEDVLALTRWKSGAMAEVYDRSKDARRDRGVSRLDELAKRKLSADGGLIEDGDA